MRLETQVGLETSLAIIAFAFLVLTVAHLRNYWQDRFPHLERPKGIAKINGLSTGMVELAGGINEFVDGLNNTHKKANKVAAIGYGLSFGATLVSLIVLIYTEF